MTVKEQAALAATQLIEAAKLNKGSIVVVGCSTSEVVGSKIGTDSQPDVAKELFDGIYEVLSQKGIYLAAQCCEHLNRAIIIEAEAANGLDVVNVVPQPKAGGSFATAAYAAFKQPVAVEEIKADAGLDIGGTLIGFKKNRNNHTTSVWNCIGVRVVPEIQDMLKTFVR